jgi:hypothetical protein
MKTIPLKAQIQPDGSLDLHVQTGLPAGEAEVVVVVSATPPLPPRDPSRRPTPEELGWPPGFFDRVAGGWVGEGPERPDLGELPTQGKLE